MNIYLHIKKMLLPILLICVLSFQGLNAQNRFDLEMAQRANALNLFVDLGSDIPYTISLVGENGQILWNTMNKQAQFAKSILVDGLSDGQYQILVASESRYYQNGFTVSAGQGVAISKDRTTIVGPEVSVMNRSVLVDFDFNGDLQDVDVQIFNARNKEVFANAITTDDKRITSYDMSQLPAGQYEMIFTIQDRTFVRRVRIR